MSKYSHPNRIGKIGGCLCENVDEGGNLGTI